MDNDLISRRALKQYVNDCSTHWLNEWDTAGVLLAIERMPAVDPETLRPTGHWNIRSSRDILHRDVMFELFLIECSECKRKVLEGVDQEAARNGEYRKLVEQFPYCHCGCKMMEG